ncbi:MAG: hypothetical protein WAM44_21055, partial [Chthoniobacterales bacterium]
MPTMKSCFVSAALIAILAYESAVAAKKTGHDSLLVTAPSGDFQLIRKSDGAIWLVATKQPNNHVVLPSVQV